MVQRLVETRLYLEKIRPIDKKLKYQIDMQEGFENIPTTLQRLFTGKNLGKQLLKVADPE